MSNHRAIETIFVTYSNVALLSSECRYCPSSKLKLVSAFEKTDKNISWKNRDSISV